MLKESPNLPGGVLTQKDDPRILPMGKFLRKTKINELPQLVNIFLGEMSIIGPRPQAKRHYDLYSDEVKAAINPIPPGLSGIASIVFRDEEYLLDRIPMDRDIFHDTIIAPYKGQLERWYTNRRTLINYFLLILLTLWMIIRPKSTVYNRFFKYLPEMPEQLKSYLS
jgi:lipopolysaccharide/colanic/teichoic acid biosynthesis glycosyltransferase